MNSFSILVNTCDKYEDCWEPFFRLFSIYWPNFEGKIYLNTEYKDFSYPGLNIYSIKNAELRRDAHKITWSKCLSRALDKIDDEIVLYMQEDYFLKKPVENDIISNYIKLMRENENIHCIHLTDQAVRTGKKAPYNQLLTVDLKQPYRISCQAALWQKDVLKSYLRSYENAWQFEEFGSKRAALLKHNFFAVDNNWVKLNKFEIIPYIFTGIIAGKWIDEVVPLFEKHNIDINYNERGFVVKGLSKKNFFKRIKRKISRTQVTTRYYLEVLTTALKLTRQDWKNV